MKNSLSVLSFDLGGNLGWAKSTAVITNDTFKLKVADHGVVDLNALTNAKLKQEPNLIYDRHRVRMNIYANAIRKLSTMVKFDVFCVEDIFLQRHLASSFKLLTIYTEILEGIINTERQQLLYRVSPTLVKKSISNYGHADKLEVQRSLLANKNISVKNVESLASHNSDAICVAYAFVARMIQSV